MLSVFLLFNFLFIYFFYSTGYWQFSAVPVLFLLFMLFWMSESHSRWQTTDDGGQATGNRWQEIFNNVYFISWFLMLFGGWLFLSSLDIGDLSIFVNLLGVATPAIIASSVLLLLNVLALIGSLFLNYSDGKWIFHAWTYVSIILYIIAIMQTPWHHSIFGHIFVFCVLMFALYAFIYFIVGSIRQTREFAWFVFLFFHFSGIIFLYSSLALYFEGLLTSTIYLLTFFSHIYMLLVYLGIYYIQKLYQKEQHALGENILAKKQNKIIDQILSGSKSYMKDLAPNKVLGHMYQFIISIPEPVKIALSALNVLIVVLQIFFLWKNMWSWNVALYEISYWLSIVIFFVNFILLKQINFYSFVQRICVFFLINFGIYLTVINNFWSNYMYIVVLGVIWNLLNSFALFGTKYFNLSKIFYVEDYYFWIWSNLMAMAVNCFFLFKLWLQLKISIALLLMYTWFQLFLTYYNVKYLKKLG